MLSVVVSFALLINVYTLLPSLFPTKLFYPSLNLFVGGHNVELANLLFWLIIFQYFQAKQCLSLRTVSTPHLAITREPLPKGKKKLSTLDLVLTSASF